MQMNFCTFIRKLKSIITVLFCLSLPLVAADKKPLTLACLLALLILPTPNAQADSQARVAEILQELKSHPVRANDAQIAKSIERLKELGKLGPAATSAVPFLLSEDFFLIKGGYIAMNENTSNYESTQLSQMVILEKGARYEAQCRMRWDSFKEGPGAQAAVCF